MPSLVFIVPAVLGVLDVLDVLDVFVFGFSAA